jgi:hypothetical protein
MDKFIENNQKSLLKIYNENIKNQGNGILFIDYTQSKELKVDCSFVPENMIQEYCNKNEYLNYSIFENNTEKIVFLIFDKIKIFLIK